MSQFHVNRKGEPGPCRARSGRCPFGGAEVHYSTPEAAREAYELRNQGELFSRAEIMELEATPRGGYSRSEPQPTDRDAELLGAKMRLEAAEAEWETLQHGISVTMAHRAQARNGREAGKHNAKLRTLRAEESHIEARMGVERQLIEKLEATPLTNTHVTPKVETSPASAPQLESFTPARVRAMAVFALGPERSGGVKSARSWGAGRVEVAFSNLAAAQAAAAHFEKKGWVAEYTGRYGSTESVKVYDPRRVTAISTREANWDGNGFSLEASQFPHFDPKKVILVSQKNGKGVELIDPQVVSDEGDVTAWIYRVKDKPWTVTIFND